MSTQASTDRNLKRPLAVQRQLGPRGQLLKYILIAVQGVGVLFACFAFMPLGIALALLNGVAAYFARGTDRKLFATICAAGLILSAVIVIFFLPVSP